MKETLKPNMHVDHNPIGWSLPIIRANILHALGQEKEIDYKLDPYYKGIKISPKILYRLQSGQTNFTMEGNGSQRLRIMDGKFIITDAVYVEKKIM